MSTIGGKVHLHSARERDFFIDNLPVKIHVIIEMIWWTGLAPWEFDSAILSTSTLIKNTLPRGPYKVDLQGYLAHKTPPSLGAVIGP
jgi:hypothetical protein